MLVTQVRRHNVNVKVDCQGHWGKGHGHASVAEYTHVGGLVLTERQSCANYFIAMHLYE